MRTGARVATVLSMLSVLGAALLVDHGPLATTLYLTLAAISFMVLAMALDDVDSGR